MTMSDNYRNPTQEAHDRAEREALRQSQTTATRSRSKGQYGDRLNPFSPVPDIHSPAPIKMIHYLTGEVHQGGRAPDEYVRYRLDDTRYPQPTATRATDTWKRISEGIPTEARAKGMIIVKRYDPAKEKWQTALAYANVSGGWSTGYGQIEDFDFWAEIPE